jgi:hypothetical protein
MEKNPNYWHLLTMFFLMAMLFVSGPIQGNPIMSNKHDIVCTVNSPPITHQIDFNVPLTITVTWLCTSMPGVQNQSFSINNRYSVNSVYNEMIQIENILSMNYINISKLNKRFYANLVLTTDNHDIKYRLPRDGLRKS